MNLDIKLVPPSVDFQGSFLDGLSSITAQTERSAWLYLGDSADLTFPTQDFKSYIDILRKRQTQPPE